jgi:ATP synthase protein I
LAGHPVFVAVFPFPSGRIDMAASDPDKAPEAQEDPRLASLDAELHRVRQAEAARKTPLGQPAALTGKGASQGQRVLSALIGAPLGGALIGWLIDRWLDSSPAGLLVMLFLGFGAAISQVLRISKEKAE